MPITPKRGPYSTPIHKQDTENQVLAIWQPSRFSAQPMKVAMLLNDDSGNRDF
jgi:hypothetical protein